MCRGGLFHTARYVFFCLCVQETKRFSLTTTRRQKNENYKTTKLLFKVLNIPLTYFVKCRRLSWSGIPRPISKFTKKEIKFRRCLFTFPTKCEIMHFYSVVVQNKKYTNKCDARAKLLFCLLNLLFFLTFWLPSLLTCWRKPPKLTNRRV